MTYIQEKIEDLYTDLCKDSTQHNGIFSDENILTIISKLTAEEYIIDIEGTEIVTIIYHCRICGKFDGFKKICIDCNVLLKMENRLSKKRRKKLQDQRRERQRMNREDDIPKYELALANLRNHISGVLLSQGITNPDEINQALEGLNLEELDDAYEEYLAGILRS